MQHVWGIRTFSLVALVLFTLSLTLFAADAQNPYAESRIADLPYGMSDFACSDVINGKIYLFGGNKSTDELTDTILVYDIAANTWRSAAGKMPYPIGMSGTTNGTSVCNGKVYITPGLGPTRNNGWGQHQRVIEFDPVTETARERASFGTTIWNVNPATVGNYVYWIGGSGIGQTNNIWKYDPRTDSLTVVLKMSTGNSRITSAATGTNGKVYLVGGNKTAGRETTEIQVYNPKDNTLIAVAATLPENAGNPHVWLGNPHCLDIIRPPYNSNLWRYDIQNGKLEATSYTYSFATVRDGMGHAYVPATGDVYFFGGFLAGGPWSNVQKDAFRLKSQVAAQESPKVYACGENGCSQLGDGSRTNRPTPVAVPGLSGVVAVSAAWTSSLALKDDGTVWGWGDNQYGQLGDGTTTDRLSPVQVVGLINVTAIAEGSGHSLALKADGTVWTWGRNVFGQLGDGTTTNRSTPVRVAGLSYMTRIAAGGEFSLAVSVDGSVYAWGRNQPAGGHPGGELGDGTTTDRFTPIKVPALSDIITVACGEHHSVALKADGTVWAWGSNISGQLGNSIRNNRQEPVKVSGLADVVALAASWEHTLVLKADGSVWTWGQNGHGELGDGSRTSHWIPMAVPGLSHVVAVSAGFEHSRAQKSDGSVWAWGKNDKGELGDGTFTDRLSPVLMSVISSATGLAVESTASHSFVICQ